MTRRPVLTKLMAFVALIGLVTAAYLFAARPYQLRWGSSADEASRVMPGDELSPDPTFLATRAITINGTPGQIWPWLIQMGYGRAGYYGYDVVENLGSPRGIGSAEQVLPQFQRFEVGDAVPISVASTMKFYAIAPDDHLIWAGLSGGTYGTFNWALYPIDASHTRLVSRIRWTHHWTEPSLVGFDLFTEFTDHLAVRKILQGVKGRVEGRIEPMAVQNTEVGLYVASALTFLAGLLLVLAFPLTRRRWLAGLAAGVAWLVIWYAPVPLWVAILVELVALSLLVRARVRRRPSRANSAVLSNRRSVRSEG